MSLLPRRPFTTSFKVCKLLQTDKAVSGRIPIESIETMNDKEGGWLAPDPSSMWLEPALAHERLPIDVATIRNSDVRATWCCCGIRGQVYRMHVRVSVHLAGLLHLGFAGS